MRANRRAGFGPNERFEHTGNCLRESGFGFIIFAVGRPIVGRTVAKLAEIAGDITGASSALAGLLLVFLGATQTSFESYDKAAQKSVLTNYQWKARLAFAGFVLSLIALVCSLLGKRFEVDWLIELSLGSLLLGVVVVLCAAAISTREIS